MSESHKVKYINWEFHCGLFCMEVLLKPALGNVLWFPNEHFSTFGNHFLTCVVSGAQN